MLDRVVKSNAATFVSIVLESLRSIAIAHWSDGVSRHFFGVLPY